MGLIYFLRDETQIKGGNHHFESWHHGAWKEVKEKTVIYLILSVAQG